MLQISAPVSALLRGDAVEAFYLVGIDTFYRTSHSSDVNLLGNLYESDGSVLSVDPPLLSSTVDRQLFKLTLTDVGIPLGSFAENGILGLDVVVYVGFIDPSTGVPYTSSNDYIKIYSGYVDGCSYSYSMGTVGERLFSVTCSTPMGDLDLKKPIYTSQNYLDKNNPGDTSFQQIYEGSGPIEIRWGRT
jgi:hypothetical protein